MMKAFGFVALAVSVIASAGLAQTSAGPSSREPEITATGWGETHLPPTFAIVMIAVSTRAGSATEAASQNATKVASTVSSLRNAGVGPDDVSNEGYNVEQAYNEKSQRVGFTARNSIRVRVPNVDQVGKIIDAALAGGATDISSVNFGAASIEDARRAAMTEAVRQARADAEIIASAAGGRLGRLISLSAASGLPPGYGPFMLEARLTSAGGSAVPTVLSPRDLLVSAQASGRWEFVPGPSR
ncbi:MAG TPA: SIMPL domain-containing protein [Gemmatimonadaceae bacterium]|nr:SIMPL domain-containing protein [Gemmatimonadaceae bacterium]